MQMRMTFYFMIMALIGGKGLIVKATYQKGDNEGKEIREVKTAVMPKAPPKDAHAWMQASMQSSLRAPAKAPPSTMPLSAN